ncbi:hypothetical protein RO3G_07632 [Lichtheimia corymbifera JMRC:FSU:9682]|uniref:C2H2-type domain-containing protein n=1 Tax=Lichtheimia corymbifera JMRC:FSU:9682 TaxID=1263082 RepID=A0A068SH22_9FUNG|nr:hypothetical protein RO3G_07632 [Lichtheimia corymbifera JMRC:FSU:9682]
MQYQEPQQQQPYFASLLEQDSMESVMDYTPPPSLSYSHMLSSAYDLATANVEYPWNWYLNNEDVISAPSFPHDATITTAPPPPSQPQQPMLSYPSPDIHHLSPPTMTPMSTMMLSPSPELSPYAEEFPMYMSPTPSDYTFPMDTPTTTGDTQGLFSSVPIMNFGNDSSDVSTGIMTPPSSPMPNYSRSKTPPATHRQRPVYKCDTCNKTFTRPYNLRSHQRTHNNDRPYPCDHPGCKWKFARPHDLKRHQLLHTGIKPHKCEHCNLRFSRRDALRRHWNVEKKCGDAEKQFPTAKSYRRRRDNKAKRLFHD